MAALTSNRKVSMSNYGLEQQYAGGTSSSHGSNTARIAVDNSQESPHCQTSRRNKVGPDEQIDELDTTSVVNGGRLDDLPPEKQLAKLRRFLQTVYRFAENLPAERDRVKQLMVDVLNAVVSVPDFYAELKGTTRFPLRPFVVPFLESSLPLIRMSMNMPVKVNTLESELFGQTTIPSEYAAAMAMRNNDNRMPPYPNASNGGMSLTNGTVMDRKRRANGASPERNGDCSSPKRTHLPIQPHPMLATNPMAANPMAAKNTLPPNIGMMNGGACLPIRNQQGQPMPPPISSMAPAVVSALGNGFNPGLSSPVQKPPMNGTVAVPSTATSAVSSAAATATGAGAVVSANGTANTSLATFSAPITGPRGNELAASTSAFQQASTTTTSQAGLDWWACQTDEWRNIETLFTTMAMTMERLRYALLLFQQRARLTQMWNEKFTHSNQRAPQDSSHKIEEMQRRADAAVQEVKRAAVNELQKAVHAAEQKALHMIATERGQMEKLLRDTQVQEESTETCRNCGRRAGQTCSGCGKARYCGVFCQHKDWPRHRATCSGVNEQAGPSNAICAAPESNGTSNHAAIEDANRVANGSNATACSAPESASGTTPMTDGVSPASAITVKTEIAETMEHNSCTFTPKSI